MICPYCDTNDDKVIDSRASEGGRAIRRRRECLACHRRFTTYERVETTARLMVVKRDGTRVPFARDNVLKGVQSAIGKRPVSEQAKAALVDRVEETVFRDFEREVPSEQIGRLVMEGLKELDQVAYIRFASEYYRFRNVGELLEELEELQTLTKDLPDQQRLFDDGAKKGRNDKPS